MSSPYDPNYHQPPPGGYAPDEDDPTKKAVLDRFLVVKLPLVAVINKNTRFYKNCKSVRKRGGKICQDCPFRSWIEEAEKA